HPRRSTGTLQMAWRIEKQSDGRFAIFSTRLQDYIVIDATSEEIERVYEEKGRKVYLASARAQIAKDYKVADESLIEASRARGETPKEPPEPIGATGFVLE
ncbi:MAG TPA: hypothetical protein VNI54_09905, partial [Thermoanaerobaculia bacterium]|nr:hypothetical protein [Thermoanaerobaculia bacterium]